LLDKVVEIIAPVGSMESLKAAVLNGANAIYLGGKLFNARHYASNFSNEELMEAVSYAHLRNVKVYVTVNILLDEVEIEPALDYVTYLYSIGVDAIIVQDLGFASLVKKLIPNMPLHASTQMTINNLEGVKHLESLGFDKVVLARETPIDEIRYIKENSSIDLETFIHGALCISYSGQCLMSSLIGGRSGNRGTCAQPCRMAYTVLDEHDKELKNWDSGYYLSTKDLNTLEHLKELIDAGVVSLKIEGRMKRPEYVATVVKAYKKALSLGSDLVTKQDKEEVEQIFNREFTKGMGLGDFGRGFITTDRPDNRGIVVGEIVDYDKRGISIHIEVDLKKGDGLEWKESSEKTTGIKIDTDYHKNQTIYINPAPKGIIGAEVRRTLSSELIQKGRETYENNELEYPIDMTAIFRKNELPIVVAKSGDISIQVIGDTLVEPSMKAPLSQEKVIEQLSKLGNTTFVIRNINIDLEEGSFIPVSKINQLRREVVQKLEEKILSKDKKPLLDMEGYEKQKSSLLNNYYSKNMEKKLSIRVSNQKQFDQLDLEKADRVYLGFLDNIDDNINRLKNHKIKAYIWTDKILYSHDLERLLKLIYPIKDNIDGISVSNLGSLQFSRDIGLTNIHCDMGLNTFNSYTADYLVEKGANSITLSPELNMKQIKGLNGKINCDIEGIVYGYLPSMIMKNCPMATFKNCKDDSQCNTCNYAHGYKLKDRIGKSFIMDRGEGFSTIYNSVPLFMLDSLKEISNSGVNLFRLDFTIEEDIAEIQKYFYLALNNKVDNEVLREYITKFKSKQEITNGHYFRGVL